MNHALVRDLGALTAREFDVCVIGGGVTGLFVAHDAAARGLSVALVERGDFAQGTSSATTKMIHGGTRYLEHYEFGLVREALRERRILMRLAPHLTRPVPFMIPIYKGGAVPASLLRAGMVLYDLLSFDKNRGMDADKRMAWHHYLSPERARELEPILEADGLKGASLYYDGQAPNPMRLCIEVAKTASANGAVLANYARAEGLRIDAGGRVTGVEVEDSIGGRHLSVRAKCVINCAGIWAVQVMEMLGKPAPVQLKPSKGIHLVTRPLVQEHALVSVMPSGRRVMVIPWRGRSLIGTTDVFYDGDLDRIRPTVDEARALLDEVNAFLPSAKLTLDGVLAAYAGARPLVFRPGKSASDLSRKYEIVDHAEAERPGMLSVLGGKLTTSRSLAKVVVDKVMRGLGREGRCRTREIPLGGGDLESIDGYLAQLRPFAVGLMDDECYVELVRSYGTAANEVLEYVRREPRLGQRIAPDRPFVWAELHYAFDREMATSLADFALRRTDVGNLGDRDGAIGRAIAAELQRARGLPAREAQRQLDVYYDQVAIDGAGGRRATESVAQQPA